MSMEQDASIYKPAKSVQEVHERMALGWDFAEARLGKGWQARYPHIASWRGGYCLSGSNGLWKISLLAHCGSEFTGFHTTTYTLLEKEVACSPEQDVYQAVDAIIHEWNDAQGADAILRFKKGWIGEADWEIRYPHIAAWIRQGKRHCISITINCITHQSYAKAWLYDKPSNTETVLFEREVDNMPESEALQMLDAGIASWRNSHEQD